MSSILTNNGAMVALQTLKTINSDLVKTQSLISTARKSPLPRTMRLSGHLQGDGTDVKGFKGISDSLSLGNDRRRRSSGVGNDHGA